MARIPHEFGDDSLLQLALTHSSTGAQRDNERLEFLGDAVLDLIVAEHLFRRSEELPEGVMTELKASVVSRRALAAAASQLELEGRVNVGAGLRRRTLPRSVLANLYEALVGAAYLDAGLGAAREFVKSTLAEQLSRLDTDEAEGNPKQELQQLCQRRWGSPPDYRVLEERGRSHVRAFLVAAEADGDRFPSAWGRTVKEAERWAAHEALLVLEHDDTGKGK